MNTPQPNQQIEAYLSSLRNHLAPITLAEREDILREIGAHIRDSVEGTGTPVETVLTRLGPPAELAAQYRDGLLIRTASRSFSPWLLLKATLRLGSKGLVGILVFLCGFTGYIAGISLLLTGLLKPFMPAYIGVWTTSGNLVASGIQGYKPQPPMHEVLGWWAIPIGLIGGAIVLVVTTFAIRLILRLSRQWQRALGTPSSASSVPTPVS